MCHLELGTAERVFSFRLSLGHEVLLSIQLHSDIRINKTCLLLPLKG